MTVPEEAESKDRRLDDRGRVAQRRRTRAAIVAGAARLLDQGKNPSVAEIAESADVSRRTVYLHFPTLEQLLIDATAGLLAEAGHRNELDAVAHSEDVHGRVDALVQALLSMSDEALPLGRRLIKLTVESPLPDLPPGTPRRGYRRTAWIEQAVAPLRRRLTEEQFERLVSGLSLVLGWEAMIVLRDLRGLDRTREERVTVWAAHALIDSMLAEVPEELTASPRRAAFDAQAE